MQENLRNWLKLIAINLAVMALIFVALEGLSSAALFGYNMIFDRSKELRSRSHVQYDALLGWVNKPNLRVKNMYGPNRDFVTNSQSFRNDVDFPVRVPPGKKRVICSGDSFTLGIGVDGKDTFCARLGALEPQLETVNLGEAGYGLDQIFLKYQRDGAKLDHDIHIFAFISDDIRRMRAKRFIYYPKPRLVLRNGELFNDNYPVPKRSSLAMFLSLNRQTIHDLRTVKLATRVRQHLSPPGARKNEQLSDEEAVAVAIRIFEKTAEINRAKGSVPIFVYLMEAAAEQPRADVWRSEIKKALRARHLIFIDGVEAFQKLDPSTRIALFDPNWTGHYTAEAHERVAELIDARLKTILAAGLRRTPTGTNLSPSGSAGQ